jgi:hypothetical protein
MQSINLFIFHKFILFKQTRKLLDQEKNTYKELKLLEN